MMSCEELGTDLCLPGVFSEKLVMYFEKAGGTWIPAFAGKTGGGRGEKNIFRRKRKNMSYIIMRNCAKFLRVWMVIVFAAGFFAVLPEGVWAQTCTSSTGQTGTCFDTAKQTCSGGTSTSATGCSGSLICCYGTVSGNPSSTCTGGTCKASCAAGETEDSTCSEQCSDATNKLYCKSSTTTGSGGTSSPVSITLINPLKYNTVQQVLMALLYALQGVIVVLSLVFIVIGAVLYITSAGNQARVTSAKTAITAALIGLAIGILAPTFLKEIATVLGWNATAPLPAEVSGARSAADILLSVLNFLLGIVGVLAIIFLVVGAIMFLGATGDMNRIGVAKKIIQYALLGIVVALASLVIVRQLAEFFAPATS